MSRGRTGKPASIEASIPIADGRPAKATAADQVPKPAKRRRRDTAAFEQRIGYRFKGGRTLEFVPRTPPFGAGSDPSNIVDACYPYGSIQVPGGTEPIVQIAADPSALLFACDHDRLA